jgi:hypothetical protein
MPGPVPGIHALLLESKTRMAGTSPAMTSYIVAAVFNYKLLAISSFMISLVPA